MFTAGLSAQATAPQLVRSHELVDGHERVLQALDLERFTLQRLSVPARPGLVTEIGVVIEGEAVTLQLRPHDVRSSEYQLFMTDADGSLVPAESGPLQTFRGSVLEWPGSRAAGSMVNGELDAIVSIGEGLPVYGIQAARPHLPSARADDYVVHSSLDVRAGDWTCAEPLVETDAFTHDLPPAAPGYLGASDVLITEIACDADFEYYQLNGSSVANTEADILNIINRVEEIYEPDVGLVYEVTAIVVRTSEPDPYNTTNPGGLLGQFRSHWQFNHAGIQRDIAHFFTGKNVDGSVIGIASLGVICNLASGYGLSQSRFTSNLVSRTGLTAHELGHNWSAPHCNGQSDCGIMCSGLGGCTGVLTTFGATPRSQIIAHKQNKGCLEDLVPPPLPTISNVSPGSVAALDGGEVVVTGESFKKVQAVTLNGVEIDDVTVVTQQELRFDAPLASVIGANALVVENITGPSAAASLDIVPVSAPVFRGPDYVLTFGIGQNLPPAVWEFASQPGDQMYLLYGFDLQTAVIKGYSLLTSPNPPLLFALNPAGVGKIEVPAALIPGAPGLQISYFFYAQGVFLDAELIGASEIVETEIF
ncbi:MAG: hypothetical protein DHS20C15_28290 [Planctomycetota bacterium]|nr:MAG: hypothetical protein DHS20C15_28290 [Planctomycetota bacterium]